MLWFRLALDGADVAVRAGVLGVWLLLVLVGASGLWLGVRSMGGCGVWRTADRCM